MQPETDELFIPQHKNRINSYYSEWNMHFNLSLDTKYGAFAFLGLVVVHV